MFRLSVCVVLASSFLAPQIALAQPSGNLLRNATFQDDWLTLLPENKNHHWCYSSEFYNRRDFNPDGWTCKGSWQWQDADAPMGQRRLIVQGPGAEIVQRVNWVLMHDSQNLGGLADAGRFPSIVPQRSKFPERMVRNLVFRVQLQGARVPDKAGVIEVGWCPPGGLTLADPLGSQTPPTVLATTPFPAGDSLTHFIEVKVAAAEWIKKAQELAAKDPKEAALVAKDGLVLPGTVRVAIRYQGKTGNVTIKHAELVESGVISPNLITNGGFEDVDKGGSAKPQAAGWGPPTKYRHFPGRLYYIFNTWHNGAFDNRGKVQLDTLVPHSGRHSLQMIVPPGDEVSVASAPIALKQKEARLIEVRAWVKTDKLCMLNLDALTDKGERLDGYPFIHMAPHSIGTDEWRLIRQVFRPRGPIQSMQLLLCARGVNGYTLDDTGTQPQNNVVGTIWWDDVRVSEPETTVAELAARGVKIHEAGKSTPGPHLTHLDLGERMLGGNVLRATMTNPGPPQKFTLFWEFTPPDDTLSQFRKNWQFRSTSNLVGTNQHVSFEIPYELRTICKGPYTHIPGRLALENSDLKEVAESEIWFGTWTTPIDIDLGALYLQPEQKQFVRLNLGLAEPLRKQLASFRFEVIRKGNGKVIQQVNHAVSPQRFAEQQAKLPKGLRDDLTNVLLYDLDVSMLPVQPFADPQRNWYLRVSALDPQGKLIAAEVSEPFCRLAHAPAQPPVQSVAIKKDLLYVNGQPWLPFGVVYGHVPVYAGPADPGKGAYLDFYNLPAWSMYDGFTAAPYTRKQNDFNCMRYVAGSVTDQKVLDKKWTEDNLYASSAFTNPQPAFSVDELFKQAGGKDKLDKYLAYCRTAPMVVSVAPGIEEAFGLFHGATPAQLKGLEQVVDYVRKGSGKPAMVSHGGYWNRFEFEKVPFYDIYDPETEPWYPAPLHTDLAPLVAGKNKVVWLRPQMYEDVPYERWRYHVYVEMMRGARGWQIAHGPGDASLFRGLHGEIEFWRPILASENAGPKVTAPPGIEHWSRKHQGKTYLMAATTHGLTFGKWRESKEIVKVPLNMGVGFPSRNLRLTGDAHLNLSETNSYGADQAVDQGPAIHGIHYLPGAKSWPKGTKLVQWARLDDKAAPNNLVMLVKNDGRWAQAAAWGKFDVRKWNDNPKQALWFLRSFYRHAYGFLGWGEDLLDKARPYLLTKVVPMGAFPDFKREDLGWLRFEASLDDLGVSGMLDGVGFAHEVGRVAWGSTELVLPDGKAHTIWAADEPASGFTSLITELQGHREPPLAKSRIAIAGLKKGTKIRVLFEDREIVAEDGYFIDDFRGRDLYQRFGGGYGVGYGDGPVALHLYEIP